jgi:protocadherin Fat 4
LLIGGVRDVESILERPGQIETDDFVGCIHSIVVNGRHLNLSTPLESRSISDQCQRVEDVCELSSYKCGLQGQCIDLWDSHMCNCNGLIAPNCQESFTPYSFSLGSYVEFRAGDRYKRSQILHDVYSDYEGRRKRREISTKSISLSFRTIQQDGIILFAASGKDYTLIEVGVICYYTTLINYVTYLWIWEMY